MIKYYMQVKNKQEQFRYIKELTTKDGKYSLTKVSNVENAGIFTQDEIILFFATDKTLKNQVYVYKIVYEDDPVEVNLTIGEQFHLGGRS